MAQQGKYISNSNKPKNLNNMRLSGRRESSNVEDRRGMSTGAKAGIGGIGAVIVAALFAWISGGDPMQAGLQAFQEQMQQQGTETVNP
jgi:predicted metalloprotease